MHHLRRISWNDVGLIATILMWAINMPVVKHTFTYVPPLAFTALRFLFVPILMLAVVWIIERDVSIERSLWRPIILVGLIGNTGYQLFFMIGLNYTSASNAALLVATTPIWVALVSQIRGWERLSWRSWLGIVISFVGVFVILFNGEVITTEHLIGDVFVLIASACWAYYTIGAKAVLAKYSPLRVTALTLTVGAVPLVIIGMAEALTVDWLAVPWDGWLGMAYSVIFSIAIAYILWYNGVVKVGPTRTGIYASLLPACGVISAYFILGDQITLRDGIGMIGIVGGLLLTRRG
ncbi:MAG: DMT family transporter [Roseiflexaceae bacterium]|nr:DMT family transporter [Chloroflexaceae bacterium]